MKGCFFLQRKFAPIGHQIAKHLRGYNVNEFCAYVQLRTAYNFLKSQKDIQYTALLLDEDIFNKLKNETVNLQYLQWLEQEYGLPNLWPYLYLDRVIMQSRLIREYPFDNPLLSHEEMLKALQVYAKTIIEFIEKEKPDFIVFSVVGSLGSMLLYQVAKKKGIKTLIISSTRVENRFNVTEDYRLFTNTERIFEKNMALNAPVPYEKESLAFLEKFRNKPTPYAPKISPEYIQLSRRQQIKFLLPQNFFRTIRWNIVAIARYIAKNQRDYTDENPWLSVWDKIKRKFRGIIGTMNWYYSKMDPHDEFVFFGLHMEPEIATLIAPYYADQINLIKNIAKSLPIHFKLYVKEHPSMHGFRPSSYYKQLIKIPNVKLINSSIKSFDIIAKAKLVIGISSTALWEAILLQKPVITFGDVFYNKLSMVKRCTALEELPHIVQEQLNYFNYNEREMINFLAAIFADSTPVDIVDFWFDEDQGENFGTDEGLKHLANIVAQNLNIT